MTVPAPIRLVVTDVDGTLVRNDKTLAASTIAAAQTLRRHGVKLALVSSRPASGLDILIAPLGIDTPRAGFNGAEIVDANGKTVSELTIPVAVAAETVRLMEAAGVDPWLFSGGKWLLKNAHAHYIPREKLSVHLDFIQVADLSQHLSDVHKIMGTHTDFDLMSRVEHELQAALGGKAAVARSQNYYLDVTNVQANKGFAARSLAEVMGVDPQAMACIGDMPNDTPMFAVCGLAIAMGNAPDSVKALAHEVAGSNEADGWSEAIERFVLPRAG